MNGARYNEIDRYPAQWIRNLSAANRIAPGEVDERSICDVSPEDVRAATQFHAFAGIGIWSYALRLAGIPDDFHVWTGSCPCQPFSQAGRRRGVEDERHLWPEWLRLIKERRPAIVFGEQVASKDGRAWLDVVLADLEALGFVVGAADLCAASVGAPHIRQRLYFGAVLVGDPEAERWRAWGIDRTRTRSTSEESDRPGATRGLGDSARDGREQGGLHAAGHSESAGPGAPPEPRDAGPLVELADAGLLGRGGWAVGRAELQSAPRVGVEKQSAPRELADAHGHRLEGQRLHVLEGQPRRPDLEVAGGGEARGVADPDRSARGQGRPERSGSDHRSDASSRPGPGGGRFARWLGDPGSVRAGWYTRAGAREESEVEGERIEPRQLHHGAVASGAARGLGDSGGEGLAGWSGESGDDGQKRAAAQRASRAVGGFWSDAEWVYCRDDNWRPAESCLVKMADGAPSALGFARTGANETEPEIDEMQVLPQAVGAEALQRAPGGQRSVPQAQVLQSTVHGRLDAGQNQSAQREELASAGSAQAEAPVRGVWSRRLSVVQSPHKRESAGQLERQFENPVRALSSAFALAQLRADGTAEELFAVLKAYGAEGVLQYASHAAEEVWASVGEEVQSRIFMDLVRRGWSRGCVYPLAKGVKNRVGRTRGSGNAIVAPLAKTFVEAFAESLQYL